MNKLDKRFKFFTNEIINLANNKTNNENLDYDDYINIYMKNKISLEELLLYLENSYEIILSELFYNFQKYDIYLSIIKNSYDKELLNLDVIKKSINMILEDYEDLKLDIPKLNVYFVKLLNDISTIFNSTLCNNTLIDTININLKPSSKNELYNNIISDCNEVCDEVYTIISKECV